MNIWKLAYWMLIGALVALAVVLIVAIQSGYTLQIGRAVLFTVVVAVVLGILRQKAAE